RRVNALAYSPDGGQLASAGDERSILLWDTSNGNLLATLPPRPGKIFCLAFCGPGRLAAGASDNLIRLWDLSAGGEQFRLVGHTGSVSGLAFDAQAQVLVSGSFDTTVRLWQLNSGTASVTSLR
ncbi:MAG: serine/threonine protein kinase, partial [Pirellulales bacterium]|nr:serine/threonine protein kinase [Pirellulales bacterium]